MTTGLALELTSEPVELVDAAAILLPVDGQLCKLGGAVAGALRRALPADERDDELEYVEDELARLRPIPHPQARAFDGVARWSTIVVSAAYPHNVDGRSYSPDECARMIRAAIPSAIALVEQLALPSLTATLIGTAYRMSPDLAVRAFIDGLVSASKHRVLVRWSLPDASHRELAVAAAARVGLAPRC